MNKKLFEIKNNFCSLGLFHKAILQSGVATNPWGSAPYSGVETAVKISSILGKKITDTKELIEYLRTVDATLLVEAERAVRPWNVCNYRHDLFF